MLSRILAALTIALLAGCAAAPEKTAAPAAATAAPAAATPDAPLRARATAYYAALVAGQYKEAYEFFPPGYRATWSVQAHYQIHPPAGKFLGAEVISVACVGASACDVVVSARFRFRDNEEWIGGDEIPMDLKDRWLNIDGQWYLAPPN